MFSLFGICSTVGSGSVAGSGSGSDIGWVAALVTGRRGAGIVSIIGAGLPAGRRGSGTGVAAAAATPLLDAADGVRAGALKAGVAAL